ncbi:hypothetical protein RIF29_18835 [Crotalaria pallida]|uniref:Uncharacterized protein n=1 Tax=Crotalaria pallida TaxID=3830 RepID=A0AAN9F6N7_CROPI
MSSRFSSGFQLAPFVISSGLLSISWNAITSSELSAINSKQGVGLSYKVHSLSFHGNGLKIIAFETIDHDVQVDLISSSDLRKINFVDFDLLCTERYPTFSVNKAAVSHLLENHQILDQLKSEIISSTTLIVTGSGLAGSVASLFTLSLLDTIGSGKNRPLCITFGAPLIGDKKLQQAISRTSTWNSCFLNVVSHKDPLPRLFITNKMNAYMPFGTFLLCSDAGSTSSENPDFIFEILVAIGSTHLLALGLTPHTQDVNILKLRTLEDKFINLRRTLFDPSMKLNVMKLDMAQLEWYKIKTRNQGIGYYDSYKNFYSQWDHDVVRFQKNLTLYWEKMVEEAELKPQKEGAAFRGRWLYAGTNYRKMNEMAKNKLVKFEEYVYELLENYAVSADIFLPQSSYMRWWKEYKDIKGSSYESKLASFMSNSRNYEHYSFLFIFITFTLKFLFFHNPLYIFYSSTIIIIISQ